MAVKILTTGNAQQLMPKIQDIADTSLPQSRPQPFENVWTML